MLFQVRKYIYCVYGKLYLHIQPKNFELMKVRNVFSRKKVHILCITAMVSYIYTCQEK